MENNFGKPCRIDWTNPTVRYDGKRVKTNHRQRSAAERI